MTSRQDYRAVAEIIRRHKEDYEGDGATLASVAESLATYFGATNSAFDADRFYEACGMPNQEWAI